MRMNDNNRTMINEETESRKTKKTGEARTNNMRAALAFTSPESSVGLTPLPWPWWKYGVGETLPREEEAAIGGGTLRREGAAAVTDGTAIDWGGGWRCNSGAASEAARDRDLWCSRWRRLSPSSFSSLSLSDIF